MEQFFLLFATVGVVFEECSWWGAGFQRCSDALHTGYTQGCQVVGGPELLEAGRALAGSAGEPRPPQCSGHSEGGNEGLSGAEGSPGAPKPWHHCSFTHPE